jgi:hypothetical protein
MIKYTRTLVLEKTKQCFPSEDLQKIIAILDEYGTEPHERERERVQIAVLKLSGENMDHLHEHVAMAKRDYRDVLAYAEFPEEMSKSTWKIGDQEAVNNVRIRDRQQYMNWLES